MVPTDDVAAGLEVEIACWVDTRDFYLIAMNDIELAQFVVFAPLFAFNVRRLEFEQLRQGERFKFVQFRRLSIQIRLQPQLVVPWLEVDRRIGKGVANLQQLFSCGLNLRLQVET